MNIISIERRGEPSLAGVDMEAIAEAKVDTSIEERAERAARAVFKELNQSYADIDIFNIARVIASEFDSTQTPEPEREDSERLDWLENQNIEIDWSDEYDGDDRIVVFAITGGRNDKEWHPRGYGKTLREAIDEAREQTAHINRAKQNP